MYVIPIRNSSGGRKKTTKMNSDCAAQMSKGPMRHREKNGHQRTTTSL
jgi:hypothetical protein